MFDWRLSTHGYFMSPSCIIIFDLLNVNSVAGTQRHRLVVRQLAFYLSNRLILTTISCF
ncbi:hypothetical protein Hdeb2414_s0015g00444981 [Helianthus debilis subsp. tardiflorus]